MALDGQSGRENVMEDSRSVFSWRVNTGSQVFLRILPKYQDLWIGQVEWMEKKIASSFHWSFTLYMIALPTFQT